MMCHNYCTLLYNCKKEKENGYVRLRRVVRYSMYEEWYGTVYMDLNRLICNTDIISINAFAPMGSQLG